MALTALGVAASATQLAAYGLTIISYIAKTSERVQNTPQEYHEYEVQLRNLVNTAQGIERNPALQTRNVKFQLDTISAEVRTLQSILCPAIGFEKNSCKKNWNIIYGSEQRKIAMHLKSLYQMNIALLLCITTSNTDQLSDVKGSINKLADQNIELEQETSEAGAAQGALRSMDVEGVAERLPLTCLQGDPTQSFGQAQMRIGPTAVDRQSKCSRSNMQVYLLIKL
ncbi:hypothetical protein BU23DRAFT_195111 [Bimuria novae-zelandiae CBS 107.79]|uniref:Fungal N-terminal domain-containing protein n=1 Tax=Bimuria novae-zelandiae CBS 107.79 TaxID=1447943 RepID=A0A6A5V2Q2_9PLEO|nr:hypothetical protein BU23DRAFT_195111 [Bimuria novae-zelandiae CBS 107.79]